MVTIDFFSGIQKFRELAPGVEARMEFDEMQSSASIAKKKLKDLIEGLWDDLKAYHDSGELGNVKNIEAIGYLQGAFANLSMYEYAPFFFQKKKEEGKDYYKNEIQAQKDAYISNLWSYMDSLLDLFNDNPEAFPKWKETHTYKDRKDLLIESADELNKYYEIGRSHYFFSKIIFIIREVGEDQIYSIIKSKESLDEEGNEKLKIAVKKAVAFYAIGHAVQRLDSSELPKSIGKTSSESMEKLSDSLLAKFEKYMDDIDFEMNKPTPGASVYLNTDINSEDDKSYYMT